MLFRSRFAEGPSIKAWGKGAKPGQVRLVGSGAILQQVIAAQALLAEKFAVAAEVYSAPSFALLRRDGLRADRWNRLHPAEAPRRPYVSEVLGPDGGPVIAASDWMAAVPQGIAPWVAARFVALGTDGFGRSDTRESLRAYFEIDAASIAAAAMSALAADGSITAAAAAAALADLGVDPDKANPQYE